MAARSRPSAPLQTLALLIASLFLAACRPHGTDAFLARQPTAAAARRAVRSLPTPPPSSRTNCHHFSPPATRRTATPDDYLPDAYVESPDFRRQAEELIRTAAVQAGAQPDNVDIRWAGSRIVVTISGELMSLGGTPDEEDGALDEDGNELDLYFDADELDDVDDDDEGDDEGIYGDVDVGDYVEDERELDDEDDAGNDEEDEEEEEEPSITSIAKAINRALAEEGEGSLGDRIATTHSIEVTTPGTSDVLVGEVMFEAYKGFDVVVETNEIKKKGKKRVLEGKLVERNDDVTVVNVKGRVTKVKNEKVECVRLPKAKREKGAK